MWRNFYRKKLTWYRYYLLTSIYTFFDIFKLNIWHITVIKFILLALGGIWRSCIYGMVNLHTISHFSDYWFIMTEILILTSLEHCLISMERCYQRSIWLQNVMRHFPWTQLYIIQIGNIFHTLKLMAGSYLSLFFLLHKMMSGSC